MKKVEIFSLKKSLIISIYLLSCMLFLPKPAFAQSGSYVVQVKDVLKFTFWEHESFNTQNRVDRDGSVDLPLIGRITTAGLSLDVIREKIISQMSLYNRVVTQLSIEVLEYGSNSVFVTGQVRKPGKYSWEEIPNLWQILIEAGGPTEAAALDEVIIIRTQEGGKLYKIDLTEALQDATLDDLPDIKPGDTIQVSSASGSGVGPSPFVKREIIYIFGAIARPGPQKYEASASNLLEIIGRAGGPRRDADLKKVKHISMSMGKASIAIVNVEDFFDQTYPVPMPIGPGDMIIIPQKSSFLGRIGKLLVTSTITSIVGFTIFSLLRGLR